MSKSKIDKTVPIEDHIIEIYKVEAEKFNKTRDIQWRFNIAFWTVLIVAIYAKSEGKLALESLPFRMMIYGGVGVLHWVFAKKIQGSLGRSLDRMRNIAEHLVERPANRVTWEELEKKRSIRLTCRGWIFSWVNLQLIITLMLIVLFEQISPHISCW